MDKTFEELWQDLEERSRRWAIPIVQDRAELEFVFYLIRKNECESYLEVGTAEGNGLYVLAHALKKNPMYYIVYDENDKEIDGGTKLAVEVCEIIDFGEKHTKLARDEVLKNLQNLDIRITENYGNSHNALVKVKFRDYDAVFIDAGHTYEDVIADAVAYGSLANKLIIFHDIQLPEVKKAFDWYCAQNPQFKNISQFINSPNYGYGIIEV